MLDHWSVGLPQQMDTSVASSPYFNVFLASQVKANDKGFLSSDITVQNLLEGLSHIHHVFPRSYLKDEKKLPRGRYNQIANYVVMQSEINIAIGNKPPATYFAALWEQCENGTPKMAASQTPISCTTISRRIASRKERTRKKASRTTTSFCESVEN